jgi:Ca2+-transporting ATPase
MAEAALRAGVVDPAERADRPLRDMPYESENAYSQTVREQDGRLVLHVKGAPETVAGFCTRMLAGIEETDLDFRAVLEANDVMAADGLRVIATAHAVLDELPEMFPDPEGGADVARLPEPHDLVLTGLQGMMDPPRPGVKEAIAQCRGAGIHVLMITGDHPVTARAIARRLGLPDTSEPLTGRQLRDLDDAQLRERLRATAVAARMSPQDKLRIVERLKEDGQTVAVTGDGVNDAPALRAASIGVAMGESGTEVAREASDMVLADDNFVTIVDAVRLGRVTFSSIRKATFFLLSNGLAATIAVAVNTFTELPLIFLPVMLLFTNVVTNGIQDVALSFEKGEGDELEQEPRSPKEGVLSTRMWMRTLITGVWMGLGTLLVYRMAHEAGLTLEECRTLAVITMVMFNFFQVFSARAERRSVFRMNPLGNPLLVVSALMALLLQWTATVWAPAADLIGLAPLTASQWLMCTLVGSSVLLIVELEKLVRRVVGRRAQRAEAAELPETAEAAE